MASRHRHVSDTVPDHPRGRPGTTLHDSGATVSVLPSTQEQRRDATAYLTRKGHEDLLPMLGLEPEDRRAEPHCPTCGVHRGPCESGAGKPMRRWHIARVRIKEKGDQQ